jgi:SAM-dependent methyltransferase
MPPSQQSLAELDALALEFAQTKEDGAYYQFHRYRYLYLLSLVSQLYEDNAITTMLDIGASFQTRLIDHYLSGLTIDTLGYTLERFRPVQNPSRDYYFDLSQPEVLEQKVGQKPPQEHYDLILLAEVIEHMHIRPERVLTLLHSMLTPGGHLIVQTPNAAFVGNRIKLLFGANPNAWIRDEPNNPGHYREYTKSELIDLAQRTGFQVRSIKGQNYFNHPNRLKRISLKLANILPQTFKNGFTLILVKPQNPKN